MRHCPHANGRDSRECGIRHRLLHHQAAHWRVCWHLPLQLPSNGAPVVRIWFDHLHESSCAMLTSRRSSLYYVSCVCCVCTTACCKCEVLSGGSRRWFAPTLMCVGRACIPGSHTSVSLLVVVFLCCRMYPVAVTSGNTFVLKPSEKDPGASMMLAELALQAGLPK